MGKGKIERETKREKMDFRLGGTQEEGESKVLPHLKEIINVCVCVKAKKNKRNFSLAVRHIQELL